MHIQLFLHVNLASTRANSKIYQGFRGLLPRSGVSKLAAHPKIPDRRSLLWKCFVCGVSRQRGLLLLCGVAQHAATQASGKFVARSPVFPATSETAALYTTTAFSRVSSAHINSRLNG